MTSDIPTAIFTIIILILSVIMHEVAHGYAAYTLGDQTAKRAGRLTLNPLAHIDLFGSIIVPAILIFTNAGILFGWAKPVPYNPFNLKNQRWGEAIVGVAGVATNILLALIFAVVTRVATMEGYVTFATLAETVVFVNLSLGFFNLIPVPPLDGYTVLRGILPPKMSMAFREFDNKIRSGGVITLIIILIVFSFFLSGPFYALIEWIFRMLVGS
jgi:Zn-dependent protease